MTSMALTSRAALSAVISSVQLVAAQLVGQLGPQDVDSGPHAVPLDLRLWLGGLRLLAGVPFGDLVADAELLPAESIRFFYVDRGWTDALTEGALSVGTVTTADRSALAALYGTVRAEVDQAERLVRLPGVDPGSAVPAGPRRHDQRFPAPVPDGVRLARAARARLRRRQPGPGRADRRRRRGRVRCRGAAAARPAPDGAARPGRAAGAVRRGSRRRAHRGTAGRDPVRRRRRDRRRLGQAPR